MRPTTSYRIAVKGPQEALSRLCSELVAAADGKAIVDQSGYYNHLGEAFIRVRAKTGDDNAIALGREIVGNDDFTVRTGYGVHERVIKP